MVDQNVLAIIAIVMIAVAIAYLANRETRNEGKQKRAQGRLPTKQRGQLADVRSHPRFDASTSKHIEPPRQIIGPARIVDGDTIVIKKTQIRLFGIDAPEIDHPYGQKAKWAMVALCKGNQIRAE